MLAIVADSSCTGEFDLESDLGVDEEAALAWARGSERRPDRRGSRGEVGSVGGNIAPSTPFVRAVKTMLSAHSGDKRLSECGSRLGDQGLLVIT